MLDDTISAIAEIKLELSNLSKQVNELKKRKTLLEEDLIEQMSNINMTKVAGGGLKAAISETVVPAVDDWEAVFNYIKENEAFYLLQKRISVTAYRELLITGESVPGAAPFTQVKVNVSNA